jgi:hypothetical protein
MKKQKPDKDRSESATKRQLCSHAHAVIVNPSERELREFEAMLAGCPNCSRWSPGDGPIMAVLSTETASLNDDSKGFRLVVGCNRMQRQSPKNRLASPFDINWNKLK